MVNLDHQHWNIETSAKLLKYRKRDVLVMDVGS